MTENRQRLNVLLISGNPDAVRTVSDALRCGNVRCQLMMIAQGEETLPYLRREGRFAKAPARDLVLFDAVDPRPSALRLLKAIKADRNLDKLPVVLLTNDDSRPSIDKLTLGGRELAAFSPVSLDGFLTALAGSERGRLLRAISLLGSVGSVLVQMPMSEPAAAEQQSLRDDGQHRPVTAPVAGLLQTA